ncbi:recombination regulator RecX [Kitasatospora sp. GP82]|uniref:recombination regulator RecX n=1 Tax=Kitasatospora sp. GP82 TaxID=3035089 RepID=UPI0024739AFE|nr:recombination regulator RecX [Kitasatospora sp. GP82]MDH6127701.1 regulatory protein [Kitasatospora sp. GP82]
MIYENERSPGAEPGDHGPPDWWTGSAEEEPPPDVASELGVLRASELPSGRRRRRTAVAAEGEPSASAESSVSAVAGAAPDRPRRERSRSARGEGRGARAERSTASARPLREEPADPAAKARDICLRLLTGTAKTRKQLADALRKREIPDDIAEEVLSRYEEVGLIDDAAFAEAWVESRHAVRGLSRRALAQELRTKGVAGEVVEQAVAQLDADDEAQAARALVDRKLRATRGLERDTRVRRLVGMLARRGYSEGLAFRVVREALCDEGAEGGEPAQEW